MIKVRANEIVRRIRHAIESYKLTPGTKLGEQSLCEIFEANRPIVREALQDLAREGLVTIEYGRGAFVATPSREDAIHIFEVREALEIKVVQLLCRTKNPEAIAKLRKHIERELAAARLETDLETMRLGAGFHLLMAELAGNELLLTLLKQLNARIALLMYCFRNRTCVDRDCLNQEHVELVNLIDAGDEETAVKKLIPHLQLIEKSLELRDDVEFETSLQRALAL